MMIQVFTYDTCTTGDKKELYLSLSCLQSIVTPFVLRKNEIIPSYLLIELHILDFDFLEFTRPQTTIDETNEDNLFPSVLTTVQKFKDVVLVKKGICREIVIVRFILYPFHTIRDSTVLSFSPSIEEFILIVEICIEKPYLIQS